LDDNRKLKALRVRFYGSLELMVLAWAALSLALGAALALSPSVHYALAMTGLLVILGVAMRSRTYRSVRPLRP
jgi:hypothetical protein